MEELEISGKRYISTRLAGRQYGYHSDYMGQLLRNKKVMGQKVGRSWYIDELSLTEYLGKAPQSVQPVRVQPVQPAQPAQLEQPVRLEQLEQPVQSERLEQLEQSEQTLEIKKGEPKIETIPEPVPESVEIKKEVIVEDKSTRVPIHTRVQAPPVFGGLRYAPDDSPSIPTVVRMPRTERTHVPLAPVSHMHVVDARFPFISLCIVGVLTILAATFASQFVSTSITSAPGKTAIVESAIHW